MHPSITQGYLHFSLHFLSSNRVSKQAQNYLLVAMAGYMYRVSPAENITPLEKFKTFKTLFKHPFENLFKLPFENPLVKHSAPNLSSSASRYTRFAQVSALIP